MSHYIVCLVTIDDPDKAVQIARVLVEKKLVACVNIIPEIRSIYSWRGKLCDETERLLIMKTRAELFAEVESQVKSLHPYEVPEIIAMDIQSGLADYLRWIDETTAPTV
ncbi:MAG TPA: divalent-cation tolerance protein CutA [Desulfomonilaceae bacterium]|nr:divalent-cation tolerance protein CutA [Desulfomonilaceae bacterium]